jgi:hypothetical protein
MESFATMVFFLAGGALICMLLFAGLALLAIDLKKIVHLRMLKATAQLAQARAELGLPPA